ncbi:helix-turn-helix domain-containing protein [Salinimicrobium xinjiangense]|uniref:response regulator transcription factor n=1 Tax=Salinimicrobium xinjiangense TaxID=438596 RepID=UPI0003F95E12|nr:response regulator transcription factor [Salinimicrobium xinjiangense]
MFKKVLIAEDIDAVNSALKEFLLQLGIREVIYCQYCDEAYLKLKKAAMENTPFDLLICDLSFKQDHRTEQIFSGDELALKIKQELPDTKVIIHSIEDQPGRVKKIVSFVDAYVCKGRHGMHYLQEAMVKVREREKYLSPDIRKTLEQTNLKELTEYELSLLRYISQGYSQEDISESFKSKGMAPFSKSSIEKKLRDLREDFGATTNAQLVSIVMTLQLI